MYKGPTLQVIWDVFNLTLSNINKSISNSLNVKDELQLILIDEGGFILHTLQPKVNIGLKPQLTSNEQLTNCM